MASERSAGAYLRPESILVHAQIRTLAGIGMSVPPVFRLPRDVDPLGAGSALVSALSAFRDQVPNPSREQRTGLAKGFLRAAGFRSWRALENGARSCWIEERDERLWLTPLRNGGTKGDSKGFQPFGAEPLTVGLGDPPREMGRALLEALGRAE